MSLKKELEVISHNKDKLLEMSVEQTFKKLSEEDQTALRSFFQGWAEVSEKGQEPASGASLIAVGFILGHNWVTEHWSLW